MLIVNTPGYTYINIIYQVKIKCMTGRKKKPTRSVEKTQMNVEIYFHCLGLIIQAFVSGSLIAFSHADYLSYSGSFAES